MNIKEFAERAIRHGEVLLVPLDKLPKGLKEVYAGKEYVVGFSETHHHHILKLDEPMLRVYELDNELYLDVQKVGELEHQKTFDKHETKIVQPGFYKIQPKKMMDYFSKLIMRVRD